MKIEDLTRPSPFALGAIGLLGLCATVAAFPGQQAVSLERVQPGVDKVGGHGPASRKGYAVGR